MQVVVVMMTMVLLGGCATSAYIGYRTRPDYPRTDTETLELQGLGQPVTVYWDEAGVPHIDAANEADLVRATGFVQARLRFFQMDMLRRFAEGRLSELLGEQPLLDSSTAKLDNTMRGWGFHEAAKVDAVELNDEMRGLLTAYVEGVNAALALPKPLEYRLLQCEPEPWRIEDTFALGRLNAWSITHNWGQELTRLLLALEVGHERALKIYPSQAWKGDTSLPAPAEAHALPPAVAPELAKMFPARDGEKGYYYRARIAERGVESLMQLFGAASNAWAVGGNRSSSGKPLLAGDPHLTHFLPSIVFQMHQRCPTFDIIGITMPGLPYMLFGHNRQVAWSMTSAVADAVDLCIEKTDVDKPGMVMTPEGWKPVETHTVVVRIKDGKEWKEQTFTHRRTRNGPVLNDLYPGLLPETGPLVSIRWNTDKTAQSFQALREAGSVTNVQELQTALQGMVTPIGVYTAADVHGNVGLFSTGVLPVRTKHDGTFPIPGWMAEYDWTEYIPKAAMPATIQGGDGIVSHTNNLMYDPAKTEYLFQVDSGPSYRRDRVIELIGKRQTHTVDDFASMQMDAFLNRGKRVAPKMLEYLKNLDNLNPAEEAALATLEDWDYYATVDCAATAIFFATYREAARLAVHDELSPRGLSFIMSMRYAPNIFDQWFDDPKHPVWQDITEPGEEDAELIVGKAFRTAVAWLQERQDKDPKKWRWGSEHYLLLKHAFGGKSAIAGYVNLESMEAPGGMDSIWKSHFDMGNAEAPFKAIAGPVFRIVVDTADINHSWWVIETGASGWPGSPHYGDQFDLWSKGKLLPMVFDWDEVKKGSVGTMTLQLPKKEEPQKAETKTEKAQTKEAQTEEPKKDEPQKKEAQEADGHKKP